MRRGSRDPGPRRTDAGTPARCSRETKFAAGCCSAQPSGDRGLWSAASREVKTPKVRAPTLYVEGGWPSLSADPAYGGQGLPHVVDQAFYEMLNSANQAWTMYPGLAHGAYECLREHASEAQKALYLPKLVSGQWVGTMCLTEAHCGTDLGLLRTKAEPQGDGSYRISGSKILSAAARTTWQTSFTSCWRAWARIRKANKNLVFFPSLF
jgi:alkylation response protein AidB-like acyl-CoA dehydrogenase